MKPVVWVTPRFGVAQGCTGVVATLWQEDKNVFWMWDLTKDPEVLRTLSLEELRRRLRPTAEERRAGVERLPLRKLKANASPFVCANLRVLSSERAARYGIDLSVVPANLAKLREVAPLVAGALREILRPDFSDAAPEDPDSALYSSGFPSAGDKARFAQIRKAAASTEGVARLAQKEIEFDNPQFTELFLRFRARNWPETLTLEEAQCWKSLCRRRIVEGADGALTVNDYFEQIDAAQESGGFEDERRQELLEALYEWGERLGDAVSE